MRFLVALALLAAAGCAPSRALCPGETTVARHVYSGGGDAQWCRRPDGVREGPESRVYENGVESISGMYVDGAQSGLWRYRFNDGRNWRAERWDDGALLAVTVDPAVARMTPSELAAVGPTTSGVIKLAARDPSAAAAVNPIVAHYPDGAPRLAGAYDAEGLRTGIWRFWHPNGRLAREIEFAGGVRDRGAREWYETGAPAADGFYAGGVRDGRWRFWDAAGSGREITYATDAGVVSPGGPTTGMLPVAP
ncbi:MAG: toxin-antitoxin system YwqK family antitoxin [Polyangia bacterium]